MKKILFYSLFMFSLFLSGCDSQEPNTDTSTTDTTVETTQSDNQKKEVSQDSKPEPQLTFFNEEYKLVYNIPKQIEQDFYSLGYEWTTNNETVENWTKLITTRVNRSNSPDYDIYANYFAQNVAQYHQSKGGTLIETSVFSPEESAQIGVKTEHEQFLIVVAYEVEHPDYSLELTINKVTNNDTGGVNQFSFSQRLPISTAAQLQEYLSSDQFQFYRIESLIMQLPY